MLHFQTKRPGMAGLFFLLAIFIEIASFIVVGRLIGVLATLGLIILAMAAGFSLFRMQGQTLMADLQKNMVSGRLDEQDVIHTTMMMVAAILLIIPGFVSDIIAILLLIPKVRNIVWLMIRRYFAPSPMHKTNFDASNNPYYHNDKVIDLNAEDFHANAPENSPWRQDNDENRRLK